VIILPVGGQIWQHNRGAGQQVGLLVIQMAAELPVIA